MTNTHHFMRSQQPQRQRGAALIISLILLVIMTLLGLAGIRGITQEERMANHSLDRSLAFQATEAALRDVEQLVEANKPTPTAGCSVVATLMSCAPPAATDTPRWLDDTFTSWQALSAVGTGVLAVTPEYFVEFLGADFECRPGEGTASGITCKRYRVTARSHDGSSARSSVMLQSIYATD
ncbi:MAG: PilX N-terminal domain-containing pilus assembly protein [Rhodoferax sp.]|uniref:pilus assembly PilX family protein n=1 Tax=Rhodoferax sp. TaxID=50421 RepID=UPI00261EE82D|nr:PilX N-terminal domain-containing pilus assembly protein [Rhodoferax sp.]MDD2879027.1 PilX N-terminal domain-containing pilus assembly protein [Rhodoferax sp.]